MIKDLESKPICIEDVISKNDRLPVLPPGIPHLLHALADENISYQKLELVIGQFPSITARLLYLANSAWAAPRVPVNSLKLACVRLGLTLVRSVSITLAVSSPFNPSRCPSFDAERFWCTALLVADGSKFLASYIENDKDLDLSAVHTAGLLHNLGLLWLAENRSRELSRAFEVAASYPETSIKQSLQDIVGTDYCEIGAYLGKVWSFPNMLVSTMEYHGNPDYTGDNWKTIMMVGAAEEMVSALFKGLDAHLEDSFRLDRLNITPAQKHEVYEKLKAKFKNTCELARTLFYT